MYILRGVQKCQRFHECTKHIHLTFWLDFIIFMGIFGTQKMLMCTIFWERGSQKVYGLHTRENIDIYGRSLRQLVLKKIVFTIYCMTFSFQQE